MDIGQRLKSARNASGLTQEYVAEKLGVSRQTIYNWENNKFYPDIMSVIALSDLYSVSLDVLLKEDKNMMKHLEASTNVVKSNRKLSTLILTVMYFILWAAYIIVYWFYVAKATTGTFDLDAMLNYGELAGFIDLLYFSYIMPAATFIVSVFAGKDESLGSKRWLLILIAGAAALAACLATRILPINVWSNSTLAEYADLRTLTTDVSFSGIVFNTATGMMASALGILIGMIIRAIMDRKSAIKAM